MTFLTKGTWTIKNNKLIKEDDEEDGMIAGNSPRQQIHAHGRDMHSCLLMTVLCWLCARFRVTALILC